jgi:hypothetical protein
LNTAVILATGITALALFLLFSDWASLREGQVRRPAYVVVLLRWILVVALAWVLIAVASTDNPTDRTVSIIGLGGFIGALMLVPTGWFTRLIGRQATWKLRGVRVEVTQATNRLRRDPASVSQEQINDLFGRINGCRSPSTAELCDLLTAEIQDVVARTESWNEAGRRAIRIDELCRQFWGRDVPPPDFSAEEATYRWRLYRTFGLLIERGVPEADRPVRTEFVYLLRALGGYRRSDTSAFIHDVRRSALRWLADGSCDRPWIEQFDFTVLGPGAVGELRRIWGRDSVLWGAELDADDRLALQKDRAGRAAKSQARPGP